MHTRVFKVSGAALFTYVLRRRILGSAVGKVMVVGAALLLAALVVLGILYDVRYAVLSLIVVCILLPFSLALFYISDALRPGIFFNTLPHVVALCNDRLIVSVAQEECSSLFRYPLAECSGYSVGGKYVYLRLGSSLREGVILLPADAFGTIGRLNAFLSEIPVSSNRKNQSTC